MFSAIFLLISCNKDNLTPNKEELSPKVEGRVVGAYVTYYGNSIPDPTYFTHLFYAFFELYMDNGQYKGFKVERLKALFVFPTPFPTHKAKAPTPTSGSTAAQILQHLGPPVSAGTAIRRTACPALGQLGAG